MSTLLLAAENRYLKNVYVENSSDSQMMQKKDSQMTQKIYNKKKRMSNILIRKFDKTGSSDRTLTSSRCSSRIHKNKAAKLAQRISSNSGIRRTW